MRVAVEAGIFDLPRAGIGRYLGNMLACMFELAPEVEFLLYSPRDVKVSLPEGNWRMRTESGWLGRTRTTWVQEVCPRWLAADRADVFWGQNHAAPVRLRRPCYRVVTLHDLSGLLFPQTTPLRSRIAARLQLRPAVRSADTVVVDSLATLQLAKRCLGKDPGRLVHIPLGYAEVFRPRLEEATAALPERFGLGPGYLLCVGTLEPRKGYGVLLDALEESGLTTQLVVVGGAGWKSKALRGRVARLEVQGAVRYLGHVSDRDLVMLYNCARLLVCPSHYEGFGLPVLEAMACGCPVLCSWSSSLPEVAGAAARYFRRGDAVDLAGRLVELIGDDQVLQEMARAGIKQAEQFSFRGAAAAMLEVFKTGAREAQRR